MKFKEIKPDMVIHCPTEEDAKKLYKYCDIAYNPCAWYMYKFDTCCHLCGVSKIQSIGYGSSEYFLDRGFKITEFSDLVEPVPDLEIEVKNGVSALKMHGITISKTPEGNSIELRNAEPGKMVSDSPINSPTDSPMIAVKVLEWLRDNDGKHAMKDVFGCTYYNAVMDNNTAQEVVDKITAYEAAKKALKPVELESGWHCHIYTEDESKPDTIISIPDAPEYDLWGVTEDEALEDAKSKAKKFTAETGQMALAHIWFKCRVKEDES